MNNSEFFSKLMIFFLLQTKCATKNISSINNLIPFHLSCLAAPQVVRRISRQSSSLAAEEPVAARRSPSPARNPVSAIVHVRNLVRPFTLGQLKEMLGRTGTLLDEGFWIDKIKSHCYAQVSLVQYFK